MLIDTDGKVLTHDDVALLVANLLADREALRNDLLDSEDSRVAHG
jgi:hypothetical protein